MLLYVKVPFNYYSAINSIKTWEMEQFVKKNIKGTTYGGKWRNYKKLHISVTLFDYRMSSKFEL